MIALTYGLTIVGGALLHVRGGAETLRFEQRAPQHQPANFQANDVPALALILHPHVGDAGDLWQI